MRSRAFTLALAGVWLLGLAQFPIVLAHGSEEIEGMRSNEHGEHGQGFDSGQTAEDIEYPPTYFTHPHHVAILYAHIALMVLAWVFALPIAVMLSLAKSRHTLLSQLVFTVTNAVGVLLAIIYNAQTPDLYPNNAHHSVGWVATWLASSQIIHTSLTWVARRVRSWGPEHKAFLPVPISTLNNEQGQHDHDRTYFEDFRLSDDNGRGSGSMRSQRSSSASTVIDDDESFPVPGPHKEYANDDEGDLEHHHLGSSGVHGPWAKRAASFVSSKVWKYFSVTYKIIDRIILPMGFIALTTGIVTLGRFFEGDAIFSGLAHWIKGGVFFWLGLFTLGRWSGSFGELGWAWNIRPQSPSSKWRPSAEFVESALIFFYGSTNIFMEHLGSWGEEWSAQDFEHLSITVLFIGGGLCGMLIESTRIRELLNVSTVKVIPEQACSDVVDQIELEEPATYKVSLNPIPALVILLLGIMMSSHHQDTMISTMVHKQWGNLLAGASFARGLTYMMIFLRPPTSVFPSRPPTELLTAFGLIAGGIVFMASSADTIQGMIHYNLDAMFMYTVTMGLVGVLMAWEIVVLAIKGLATRTQLRARSAQF